MWSTGQLDCNWPFYVREEAASVVTPVKELKGFPRIRLDAGESKTVTFHLKQSDLAFWGATREWRVEPGKFTVTVGGDSESGSSASFDLK